MKGTKFVFMTAVLISASVISLSGCSAKNELVKNSESPAQKQEALQQQASSGSTAGTSSAVDSIAAASNQEKADRTSEGNNHQEASAEPARKAKQLADIHFDFDRYNLKQEDRMILQNDAKWLSAHRGYKIKIEGNCDERGTEEYNMALGNRRALAAKEYLLELGVRAKNISTISYGKEHPLDTGHNEKAWAKNRRDHFLIGRNS